MAPEASRPPELLRPLSEALRAVIWGLWTVGVVPPPATKPFNIHSTFAADRGRSPQTLHIPDLHCRVVADRRKPAGYPSHG